MRTPALVQPHRPGFSIATAVATVWLLLCCLPLAAAEQTPSRPAEQSVEPAVPAPARPTSARIAIVIDDIGYLKENGQRAVALPHAVTLSVLPFTPHAQTLTHAATEAGKELMLHVPMEPQNQVPWEPGGLSSDLTLAQRHLALEKMLEAVPMAVGINNHMGSKFTEDRQAMVWLMSTLKRHQLFFVDSRTTAASQGWAMAQATGLPTVQRDIFLDNDASVAAIEEQLEKLVALAQRKGHAVAIAHPRSATLDVLEKQLPALAARGVQLVPVSHLLPAAENVPPDAASARVPLAP